MELKDGIQNLIEENDNLTTKIQSKNDDIQIMAEKSPLEKILSNSGLEHLAENIFGNLADEDAEICRDINKSSQQILDNPMFWLRKFKSLSKKNQKDWIKAIKVILFVRNSKKAKAIISYLQWNLKKDAVDLQCYTSPAVQDEFRKRIRESCEKLESSDENTEIVKILAPLTDNPNAPNNTGWTPIYWAACYGHTEIVKVLAPLTDNPNAPDKFGITPLCGAKFNGNTEIVKILIPLTNSPNDSGRTSSSVAKKSLNLTWLED